MGLLAMAAIGSACGPSSVERILRAEPLYERAFSGVSVVDATTGEVLGGQAADRLFTPASNAKIFTLATALAWLPPDSLPALAYRIAGDTLRVWGLGYPGLGRAGDPTESNIRPRLATWPGPVEVSLHDYRALPRFGEGWMWDDFGAAYMPERSGLPVYGNVVAVWRSGDTLARRPRFVRIEVGEAVLPKGVTHAASGTLARDEYANRFSLRGLPAARDTLRAPLFDARTHVAMLLEEWTGRPIGLHTRALPDDWATRTWQGLPRDSLLRAMMLASDNFLAEQLLLGAGLAGRNLTDPAAIRRAATREVLALPDSALAWADASGLSHYNLVSPAALSRALVELARREGLPAVTRHFAAGGRDGTLREWYKGRDGQPYIFAKTGTLRHTHALSGYLRARSGRWLAFSFLHNHYPGSSSAYRLAMQKTLEAMRDAY